MSVSKLAVNKPTTVIIIFILLLGLGIYASFDLPIDMFPEINPPVLLLFTNYEGTGPEEIEKTITRPLETVLSNVGNIDEIISTSSEGSSQIIIHFTWGTDMAEAANDVRDKLEFIKEYLPEDAQPPMIFKFDPSMMPIMYLALRGNRAPEELRELGENIVLPRLEQVEGVSMANISGGRERLIRVEISQNRLQAYNLTLTQIANMLRGQNVQISAGSITEGNKNYLIRTSGEYQNIKEIKNTVIAYKGGNQIPQMNIDAQTHVIRLRDIANVYDGLKKEQEVTYVNEIPSVQVIVQKQSGTNSVKTADNVHKRLKEIKKELPQNISLEVVYDNTKMIRSSLSQVSGTAITGAILAIIILFLFLRSFKTVIIIGLSIPISVIITLLLMYFFGFTLNIMTLAGLALGIGMLVDNSIVILENIYRYREKGAKLTASAILGSQEMINAIVASTLTTICVFAPVAMFKSQLGMYGELFSGLAFTVVFSLGSSLFVAIFLIPVLASKYLPLRSKIETNLTGFMKIFDDVMNGLLTRLDNLYKNSLRFVLKHRLITILIISGIFIISIFFIKFVGFQLMPQSDEDFVNLEVELPIGTKLDITKNIVLQMEQIVKKNIKSYKNIIITAGERGFFGFLGAINSHKGSVLIILHDKLNRRSETSIEIKEKLRKHFTDFPSVKFSFGGGMRMGRSTSPIDILIKSNDLERANNVAKKIKKIIEDEV
ncbi:MAG: efflux RND transporter permease subunit, partial [Spirochaetes bacterium]|nr:efflux RND transporter permease subunit [Spirochaetota bacterium]